MQRRGDGVVVCIIDPSFCTRRRRRDRAIFAAGGFQRREGREREREAADGIPIVWSFSRIAACGFSGADFVNEEKEGERDRT